jgi:hypothetical protein
MRRAALNRPPDAFWLEKRSVSFELAPARFRAALHRLDHDEAGVDGARGPDEAVDEDSRSG